MQSDSTTCNVDSSQISLKETDPSGLEIGVAAGDDCFFNCFYKHQIRNVKNLSSHDPK